MHSRSMSLCAAVTLCLSLGCAPRGGPHETPAPADVQSSVGVADSAAASEEMTGSAELEVTNESIFDVRVFVVRAGQFRRLGLVTSMSTTTFELPESLLDRELSFYADPVGNMTRQRTPSVYVRPGQVVALRLEKRMRSYSLAVW
jgi:hypothetical protein